MTLAWGEIIFICSYLFFVFLNYLEKFSCCWSAETDEGKEWTTRDSWCWSVCGVISFISLSRQVEFGDLKRLHCPFTRWVNKEQTVKWMSRWCSDRAWHLLLSRKWPITFEQVVSSELVTYPGKSADVVWREQWESLICSQDRVDSRIQYKVTGVCM